MCQEKKAGTPTAELVIDFSLAKEVRVVTSDNKMVKHDKSLVGQELSDPENDLDIEAEMDRTKPNPQVGQMVSQIMQRLPTMPLDEAQK